MALYDGFLLQGLQHIRLQNIEILIGLEERTERVGVAKSIIVQKPLARLDIRI